MNGPVRERKRSVWYGLGWYITVDALFSFLMGAPLSPAKPETVWDRFCEYGLEGVAADFVVGFGGLFLVALAASSFSSHSFTIEALAGEIPLAIVIACALSGALTAIMYIAAWVEFGDWDRR